MPRAHPPEFRQRAVELARLREKPISEIAEDLGISDSCLRSWMAQDDIDEGRRGGVSSSDRAELTELRRDLRVAKLENEILGDCRQQRRRELLRDPPTRAPRRAPLGHAPTTRPRDLRLDRSLVTTPDDATPIARCSAPSTTRPPTRHDQPHTQPVRRNGGSSGAIVRSVACLTVGADQMRWIYTLGVCRPPADC